jgi:methyl-accepting chemotaxis protein
VAVTIKMSLLVAVVFLLATLAGVSLLAKWRLASLEQSVEELGRQRLPRMRAMGEAELAVTRLRLSAVRAALATTDAERTQIKELIAERMTALDKKLDALRQLVADDSAQSLILASFTSKWRAYLSYQDKILGTDTLRSREQIGQLVNAETLGPFQDVIDAIDEGINYADIQANDVIRGAEQERGRFATLLWLLNGASILVGLGTLIFVIRDVSLPIRRITESMERIAQGELDAEIPFAERRNELGMMARAMVVFRKSLAENERLGAATRTRAAPSTSIFRASAPMSRRPRGN